MFGMPGQEGSNGMKVQLSIPIEPVGKARPRVVRTKGNKVITYTPTRTAHSENVIRDRVAGLGVYFEQGTPLRLEATFYRQRPKSLSKKVTLPVAKPDLDNYVKGLTDSLEKFLYFSDAQVTTAVIRKRFAKSGEMPHIELTIEEDEGCS